MLLDKLTSAPQQAALGVNQRATFILQNNKRTRWIRVRIAGTVTITVAGTLVRNGGSILGAISRIGFSQGSQDQVNWDARLLRHLSEYVAGANLPNRRLSVAEVVAKGTFNLFEEVLIPCACPNGANPSETYFRENNPQNVLSVFIQQAPTTVLTDGTFTLDSISASVTQVYDDNIGELPLFVPYFDTVELAIAGAITTGRVDLRASDFIAGIMVQQDCSLGEVADVVNALAYRADGVDIIGPNQVGWNDLVDGMAFESAGSGLAQRAAFAGTTAGVPNIIDAQRSWFYWQHIKNGRLSALLPPNQLPNLRLEVNAQPTALAGATGSVVRVGRVMYRRDLAVCAPELPFDVFGGAVA